MFDDSAVMHIRSATSKIGVGEGVCVTVGVNVAVRVAVDVDVTVLVAVGGSRVAVDVGGAAVVGEEVTVGVSGGVVPCEKAKIRMRINPMSPGIPNLKNAGGRGRIGFL